MSYLRVLLTAWLLALAAGPLAGSALALAPAAVTISARPAFGGIYKPGSWFPVAITVENSGPDRAGQVRLAAPGSSIAYGAAIDLPQGARKTITVYARVDNPTRLLDASLVVGDATLATTVVRLDPQALAKQLVGVVAQQPVLLPLPAGAGLARLSTVAVEVADLPEEALGLQGFSALALDSAVVSTLNDAQRSALLHWVASGGQLLIGGGPQAPAGLAALPEPLRPAEAGDATVADGEPLAALIGATTPLPPLALNEAHLLPTAEALAGPPEAPLVASRAVGRGRSLFLAAPLGSPELAAWPDAPTLWARLLEPQQPSLVDPSQLGALSADEQRVQMISNSLTNLPALDLPSLTLLGSLLVAYIVAAGPLTFLVLRRLDRQVLGWVVVPLVTLLFSAAAYGIGYRLRGGDVLLNQIDVVEPLLGDEARVQRFVGLFSPTTSAYSLDLGDGLVRPMPTFMGGPSAPVDDGQFLQQPSAVRGMTVSQWSLRGVMAESVEQLGAVEASLTYADGTFTAEARNDTATTLRNVVVARGNELARLGDMAPGEQRSAPLEAQPLDMGNSLGYLVYREQLNTTHGQQPDRETQRRQMLLDAIYSSSPQPRASEPVLFGWIDALPGAARVLDIERVDGRRLSLLLSQPRLVVASGAVDLRGGWASLQAVDRNGQPSSCFITKGQGFGTYNGDVEALLRVPPVLRRLEIEEMAIEFDSDTIWPAGAVFELWDRETADWRQVEVGVGRWVLDNWQRYYDQDTGELRLRFRTNGQPSSGCITTDLTLKGRMP